MAGGRVGGREWGGNLINFNVLHVYVRSLLHVQSAAFAGVLFKTVCRPIPEHEAFQKPVFPIDMGGIVRNCSCEISGGDIGVCLLCISARHQRRLLRSSPCQRTQGRSPKPPGGVQHSGGQRSKTQDFRFLIQTECEYAAMPGRHSGGLREVTAAY